MQAQDAVGGATADQGGIPWLSRPVAAGIDSRRYGPHLNYTPPGAGSEESRTTPDRLVKTHCCFCGQQCGIQLKVRDNTGDRLRAVGGVSVQSRNALPEGREALLQAIASGPPAGSADAHRTAASAKASWDEASTSPRAACARSRNATARTRWQCYGGASLITEKAYLLGKFARVGTGHAAHRLQRAAVHGFGGRGLQDRVRRGSQPNPMERHPESAKCSW